jgi:hypothetical protein
MQSEAMQSEAMQSEAMQSEAMQSEAMQSEAMQSEAMQSEATKSGLVPWKISGSYLVELNCFPKFKKEKNILTNIFFKGLL